MRPKIKGEPKVSLIIPTRDNVSLLKNCLESIERLTTYRNYEIIIMDNDSADPATLEYLDSTPHRVIPFREPFNYSKINNVGVSMAEGEYVLLLNDDTEVTSGEWLEAMLEHAQRPEVGAVGAKLVYPDGRIQHAGGIDRGRWYLGTGRRHALASVLSFDLSRLPGHDSEGHQLQRCDRGLYVVAQERFRGGRRASTRRTFEWLSTMWICACGYVSGGTR